MVAFNVMERRRHHGKALGLSLLSLCLLMACGSDTANEESTSGAPSPGINCNVDTSDVDFSETGKMAGFVEAHNAIRRPYGLADMTWDPALAQVAYVWATELALKNNCVMQHRQ